MARFWVVPRLHSHASWRGPAETVKAQVPTAAKSIKGRAGQSGSIHFRLVNFPDALMSRIRPWHYPTVTRHPGAARLLHRHLSGLVVVHVLLKACLTPQMPAAASDHSALAVAYDHRSTMKMTKSHPHSRVISVSPVGMIMSIRQG